MYSKGDPRDAAFYLVCAGRLRLMSGNPQRCVRKLGRGNAVGVGEFYAQRDDGPRADTLVASTASTILRLPHDAVRELDTESPRPALYLHHLLARTLSGKNSGSSVGGSFAARWARMVLKRCSSERGEREKRFYGGGKGERRRTAF